VRQAAAPAPLLPTERPPGTHTEASPADDGPLWIEVRPAGDTPSSLADGPLAAGSPFFSWSRPFDADHETRASRYYPYGTTAGGQYLLHHGVDIGNPMGALVRALADGVVAYAGSDEAGGWGPQPDFYGRLVVLRHERALSARPLYTVYGHVSAALVTRGETVLAGQPIAEVGMGGVALGPHLHLEVRTRERSYASTINPELLLEHLPGHGAIVGRLENAVGAAASVQRVDLYALDNDGPGEWLGQTTTYAARHVNSVPGWGENFVFGDTPAGRYWLASSPDGLLTAAPVTVTAAAAAFVRLGGHGR